MSSRTTESGDWFDQRVGIHNNKQTFTKTVNTTLNPQLNTLYLSEFHRNKSSCCWCPGSSSYFRQEQLRMAAPWQMSRSRSAKLSPSEHLQMASWVSWPLWQTFPCPRPPPTLPPPHRGHTEVSRDVTQHFLPWTDHPGGQEQDWRSM